MLVLLVVTDIKREWASKLLKHETDDLCDIFSLQHYSSSRSARQGRYIPDLYHLAHAAGWEPYNLHDLGQVSWVGSVLDRSCNTDPAHHILSLIHI